MGSRCLSSLKKKDMIDYYDKVMFCCVSFNNFDPAHSINRAEVFSRVSIFNRGLDSTHKIGEEENNSFVDFYLQYRNWMMEKFMNPYYYFSNNIFDCYSKKDRKIWNTQEFDRVFGTASKEVLFLAQTFIQYYESDDNKNEPTITILKMHLGICCLLKTVGFSRLDCYIPSEKRLIEEMNNQASNTCN